MIRQRILLIWSSLLISPPTEPRGGHDRESVTSTRDAVARLDTAVPDSYIGNT